MMWGLIVFNAEIFTVDDPEETLGDRLWGVLNKIYEREGVAGARTSSPMPIATLFASSKYPCYIQLVENINTLNFIGFSSIEQAIWKSHKLNPEGNHPMDDVDEMISALACFAESGSLVETYDHNGFTIQSVKCMGSFITELGSAYTAGFASGRRKQLRANNPHPYKDMPS